MAIFDIPKINLGDVSLGSELSFYSILGARNAHHRCISTVRNAVDFDFGRLQTPKGRGFKK